MTENNQNKNHYNIFGFKLKSELKEIYLAEVFRKLSISLFGVFVPIYLFEKSNLGIFAVILYFFIARIFFMGFVLLAGELISKKGLRFVLIIGGLIHIPFFLTLIYMDQYPNLFWLLVFINAIRNSFTWTSLDTDIALQVSKGATGLRMSVFKVITHIISIASPVIAAYMITNIGYPYLYATSIILSIIFTTLTFLLGENHFKYNFPSIKTVRSTFKKIGSTQSMLNIIFGVQILLGAFWPLYLYLIISDIESIGWLTSLVMLTLTVLAVQISKAIDKKPDKMKIYITGGLLLNGLGWLGKVVSPDIASLFIADTSAKIGNEYTTNSLAKINYGNKNNMRSALESTVIRQLTVGFGVLFGCIIISILALFLNPEWTIRIGIVILGIFCIGAGLFIKDRSI